MINLIDFDHERIDDVVPNELEVRVSKPVLYVSLISREEVVEDNDVMSHEHETVDEMGPHKSRAAGDENAFLLAGTKGTDGRESLFVEIGDCVVLAVVDPIVGLHGEVDAAKGVECYLRVDRGVPDLDDETARVVVLAKRREGLSAVDEDVWRARAVGGGGGGEIGNGLCGVLILRGLGGVRMVEGHLGILEGDGGRDGVVEDRFLCCDLRHGF
ncbi:hypothetical protein BC938DRAFT_472897 [Jimgerdemannia flammicorona]|uniref:Uncharacterized protein n=1 Tax=Jimgerdemannia flammicorona TaxID=994334 RepID=A0A433QTR4_9FUNG|nr:hypothetical protein BC938DRAFT_472897 [Jimgerdemannia flammicorona]